MLQVRHAVGQARDGGAIERDADGAARTIGAVELREDAIDAGRAHRRRRFLAGGGRGEKAEECQGASSHLGPEYT